MDVKIGARKQRAFLVWRGSAQCVFAFCGEGALKYAFENRNARGLCLFMNETEMPAGFRLFVNETDVFLL